MSWKIFNKQASFETSNLHELLKYFCMQNSWMGFFSSFFHINLHCSVGTSFDRSHVQILKLQLGQPWRKDSPISLNTTCVSMAFATRTLCSHLRGWRSGEFTMTSLYSAPTKSWRRPRVEAIKGLTPASTWTRPSTLPWKTGCHTASVRRSAIVG